MKKKFIACLVMAAMSLTTLLPMAVVAQTTYNNNTVRVEGTLGTAGAYTALDLVLLKDNSQAISAENTAYVDQTITDEDGDYSFAFNTEAIDSIDNIMILKNGTKVSNTITKATEFSDRFDISLNISEKNGKAKVSFKYRNLYGQDAGVDAVVYIVGFGADGRFASQKSMTVKTSGSGLQTVEVEDFDTTDVAKIKAFVWDGDFNPLTSANVRTSGKTIVCWGDSLTQGAGVNAGEDYPSQLAAITGIDVTNLGVSGETATTIAARAGAYDITITEPITVSDGKMFASKGTDSPQPDLKDDVEDVPPAGVVDGEGVLLKASNGVPFISQNNSRGGFNDCTIIGTDENGNEVKVVGTVKTDSRWYDNAKKNPYYQSITITRTDGEEPIELQSGAKLIPAAADGYEDKIAIIWIGENGGFNVESDRTNYADLRDVIQDTINTLDDTKEYIVIGLAQGADYSVAERDKVMEEAFGDNYINMRAYLSSEESIDDAVRLGLITSAQGESLKTTYAQSILDGEKLDCYNAGGDGVSTVGDDVTHHNAMANRLIAEKVAERMIALGYIQ